LPEVGRVLTTFWSLSRFWSFGAATSSLTVQQTLVGLTVLRAAPIVIESAFQFVRPGTAFRVSLGRHRARKDWNLETVSDAKHEKYPKPGKYLACVKVVDVFGCDTSITVEVDTRE